MTSSFWTETGVCVSPAALDAGRAQVSSRNQKLNVLSSFLETQDFIYLSCLIGGIWKCVEVAMMTGRLYWHSVCWAKACQMNCGRENHHLAQETCDAPNEKH